MSPAPPLSPEEKAERRRVRLRTIARVGVWSGWVLAALSLFIGGRMVHDLGREVNRLRAELARLSPPPGR